MTRTFSHSLWAVGALIILCVGVFLFSHRAGATAPVEIRWFVAHQPSSVFIRAEKQLAEELLKQSGSAYSVTFLTPEDMGFEGNVSPQAIIDLLRDGKVDLVSLNVDNIIALEKSKAPNTPIDLEVLHLPYLFNDYASADKVLDGPVGSELLGLLNKTVPAHALAFTYSGGFRVIASTNPVSTVADLKGQRINTWGSQTMQKSLASLGMTPVPVATIGGGKDLIDSGSSDGVEMTYTRADEAIGTDVKSILETNHVLFLSTLLASDSFYNSLSDSAKKVLDSAAVTAAQTERADSIALNEQVRNSLIARGVIVSPLSANDRAALQKWGSDFRAAFGMTASMRALPFVTSRSSSWTTAISKKRE